MRAKASINAPPKSPFCVIGNNGFMFGRAFGHSHSALTSWQRLLNPAQNPHSTVIFISVIFPFSPSLMTASVSSHCLQSDRAPEWTGGVIDYWQLSDRILNYYSRVWWLAGLGSALLLSMLTESFSSSLWILKCSFVRCISTSDLETLNLRDDCKWNAGAVTLILHRFYTSALQAVQVGPLYYNRINNWPCHCCYKPVYFEDIMVSFVKSLIYVWLVTFT